MNIKDGQERLWVNKMEIIETLPIIIIVLICAVAVGISMFLGWAVILGVIMLINKRKGHKIETST